jgi:hypothetical protein
MITKMIKMRRLTLNKGRGMEVMIKGFLGRRLSIFGKSSLKINIAGG